MGGSAPDPPDPVDPGVATGEYLFGNRFTDFEGVTDPRLQNRLIASEAEFRPQYAEQNLLDLQRYLFGVGDAPGILETQGQAAREAEGIRAETTTAQRTADVEDVEALGSRATDAFRASDPYTQSLLSRQNALMQGLYDRAERVTPQQARAADQQAREAFASRGRLNDNASVAAEILGREEVLRQNRAEAQEAGSRTLAMNQATAADPFQAILGRPATSQAYGAQFGSQAQSLLGSSSPQLFNPDTGINLALQNNANQANYQSNVYGAQQASMGSLFGGLGEFGAAAAPFMFSDSRLKSQVHRIGTLPSGVGWYSYRFDPTGDRQEGVMAQEVAGIIPDAVMVHESGYLMVDYSKV